MIDGCEKSRVLFLALALLLLLPFGAAGQEIRGLVAEQGSLDPAHEAVVTLFRLTEGTGDLIPVASSPAGSDGAFVLHGVGAGVYRAQATRFDLSSPLSPEMLLVAGEVEDDVSLLVPSRLPMLAESYPETSLEAGGMVVVTGAIRDGVSETPLSGARVEAERIPMEITARRLGDLRGQLLDAESGRPIPQVAIRLGDGRQQRITDEEGRFAFQALQPGGYLLAIAHLGHPVQSDEVEVPGGRDVFVRLRVSQQGMELDGIEVRDRGPGGP